jgi:hypothetical protein
VNPACSFEPYKINRPYDFIKALPRKDNISRLRAIPVLINDALEHKSAIRLSSTDEEGLVPNDLYIAVGFGL